MLSFLQATFGYAYTTHVMLNLRLGISIFANWYLFLSMCIVVSY